MSWDRIFRPRKYEHDGSVRRDPLSIGVAVLVNIGWTGAISGIGATILGSVILGAAALGVSFISNAIFSPQQKGQTPSERQATSRQPIGARLRFFGRIKAAGQLWFLESKNGFLYSAVCMNEGKISTIREYWLNDKRVTLDGSGYVNEAPYVYETSDGRGGTVLNKVARIYIKDGDTNQTVHAALDNAFPEITTAHRFRGTANFLSIFQEVPADKISEVYPSLNPNVRIVFDASIVKNVRTGVYEWSENASDIIYDALTAVDGAGFPYGAGYFESQIDLASFQNFATLSDQSVALKAGGSIKRYRIWGGYAMNEEMRAYMTRMLTSCDGDLFMTTEGKIAIRGGKWTTPSLTLDAAKGHIISAQFRHGQGALAAFNELTITYTEPTLDYQESEGDPWIDSANVALRGKSLPSQLDMLMVPHHAQARRLAKIHTNKSNPEWIGTIVTNFYGFNAIGEENSHIIFPLLGIDDDFMIQSVRILDDMTGVELTLSSLSASAYAWDAELEEGFAPGIPPDTSTPVSIDPPADFHVSAAERSISGSGVGTFLIATWTEPSRTALEQEVEYQSDPGGTWVQMLVSDGVGLAETGLVTDDGNYNVRVRTRSPGGQYGDYGTIVSLAATADTSPPSPITALAANPAAGRVDMTFLMSSSDNSIGARIYRNTVNIVGTATLIGTVYGSPSTANSYADIGLTAGTYYYWIMAVNGSDFVESASVASGAKIVT